MPMNATIASALKKLIGDGDFADELRAMLDKANASDEISRAVTPEEDMPVERQVPPTPTPGQQAAADMAAPTPAEVAPQAAKEIIVDDALMGQIVAALTSDDAFMTKLATKVQELNTAPAEPAPASSDQVQSVAQSLKELQRALDDYFKDDGNLMPERARSQAHATEVKKTLAAKATKTLAAMKGD